MAKRYEYTNHLIHEKSPYLQQHAHNPVEWYPWGQEAFNAAQEKDKPIFLSIGYATCHWCHVMEEESFEDPEIAKVMNEAFVNIKVDREELPEIDALYMEFAQSMMTGAAGWPLNMILTPDLRPFFAATYLPAISRQGLMGLTDLVQKIQGIWNSEERTQVMVQSEKILQIFAESIHARGDEMPQKAHLEQSADIFFKLADPIYGGMHGAPKFPVGYQQSFMMRYSSATKDSRAMFLVERTLDMMHRGGIYDHLGGGFSRYSVDSKWQIPHFEKMLYDNALLAQCYLEAWQITQRNTYRQVCEEILDYVLRDLTHAEGGFFSAEDADSEGVEGKYYTWKYDEIIQALGGGNESDLFCQYYGVTQEGNFEGRNVLHCRCDVEEYAKQRHLDPDLLQKQIEEQRKKLWRLREQRVHPFKDDKILSSWNGLMIGVMAQAGSALDEIRYKEAALRAARFLKMYMWNEIDGQLLRRWRDGEAMFNAGLEEYAYLIKGLLDLFESGGGAEWLVWARQLAGILSQSYKSEKGAYYQTDGLDANIILRKCPFSDGAEPSGNAVQCENLLRLHQITHDVQYRTQAEDILRAVKLYIENYPPGYSYSLIALNLYYDAHAPTLVVALNSKKEHEAILRKEIYNKFIPHKAMIWRHPDDQLLFSVLPFTQGQIPVDDKTTLYLCYEGGCQNPITDLNEMLKIIKKL